MRLLLGPDGLDWPHDLSDDDLERLYAAPTSPWLRVNMVATLDGAATGESGKTGSINNPADKRVFDTLRRIADALVVGAGTARVEGYRQADVPTVVVSRLGVVPDRLRKSDPGQVLMATSSTAPGLDESMELLGEDHVLVLGSHRVDLAALKAQLVDRGYPQLLSEGGPHLLRDLLDQGVADEVTVTVVPRTVAGAHRRITDGPPVDRALELRLLLEEDGTLLGRWFT